MNILSILLRTACIAILAVIICMVILDLNETGEVGEDVVGGATQVFDTVEHAVDSFGDNCLNNFRYNPEKGK